MGRRLRVACGYVGAVVGAGFASGREIAHFFARFGAWGLLGALAAGGAFAWVGAAVLRLAAAEGWRDYGKALRGLCGARWGGRLDAAVTAFLVVATATVLAGASAWAGRAGVPRWQGALALAAALLATRAVGRRGPPVANQALVPLCTAVALLAMGRGLHSTATGRLLAAPGVVGSAVLWLPSAVLYVSYNLVLGLAGLLAAWQPEDGPDAATGAAWGGLWLGGLAAASAAALVPLGRDPERVELPLAHALATDALGSWAYGLCLLAALWTTGNAALEALARRFPAWPGWVVWAVGLAAAFPLAAQGLGWLVAVVYPALGYAGLPLLAAVAFRACRGPLD